jgi:hypothetical protein
VPVLAINAQGQVTSASSSSIAIAASQVTSGTFTVAQGGTGATTLGANGVLLGNGTSAISATAVGATGQVLVGNTGAAPTWATLSGIGVTSFSAGTTGLTPASATTGAITLAGTLNVANGGTGTSTAFTAGSVVFAGASGVYSQDNANLFWDNANDRLGIGTATPAAKLDVIGNIRMPSGNFLYWAGASELIEAVENNRMAFWVNSAERARITSSGTLRLVSAPTGNSLAFDTSGVERARVGIDASNGLGFAVGSTIPSMTITSAGLVGIGTSSPPLKFVVSNAGAAGLEIDPTAVASAPVIQSYNRSGAAYTQLTYSALQHVFQISGSERMRLDSSSLMVGTTNPQGRLAVGSATGSVGLNTGTSSSPERGNLWYDTDNTGWKFNIGKLAGGTFTSQMTFQDNGSVGIGTSSPASRLTVYGGEVQWGASSSLGFLGYTGGFPILGSLGALPLALYTNGSERMRITSAGDVGIGTSSPASKLQIQQTTGTSGFESGFSLTNAVDSNLFIQITGSANADKRALISTSTVTPIAFATNSVERMRIDASGNVGIGTNSPSNRLTINDPGTGQGFTNAGGGSFNIGLLAGTGSPLAYLFQRANSDLIIGTNNTERMRITSGGLVGIGTSSPATIFDIAANGGMARLAGASGNNLIQVSTGSGATGIGMWAGGDSRLYSTGGMILSVNSTLTTGAPSAYTDAIVINSSGNVGIGTSSPSTILHVNAGAAADTNVRLQAGAAGNHAKHTYSNSSNTVIWTSGYQSSTGNFGINAGDSFNATGITITSAGNVGIGTSNVLGKFSVQTAAASSLSIRDGAFITTTPSAMLEAWNTPLAASTVPLLARASEFRFGTDSGGGTFVERMRIDSSGNLLVGTTSAVQRVTVLGNLSGNDAADNGIAILRAGTTYGSNLYHTYSTTTGSDAFGLTVNDNSTLTNALYTKYLVGSNGIHVWYGATNATERMRITSGGNVGIGVSSPSAKLDVNGSIIARTGGSVLTDTIAEYSGGGINLTIGTTGARDLVLRTNNTERARFDSAGNFLLGKTAANFDATGVEYLASTKILRSTTSSNAALQLQRRTTTGDIAQFWYDGVLVGSISVTGSNTAYNTSSDYRLKEIDGPIVNSGAYIDALKPVQGSWKADGSRFIGLLAHEVQEVSETTIATGEKDGEKMQAMDYSAPELIANLIAEIQ